MPIRIECPLPGWKEVWLEFRDDGWRFKDRRRVSEARSDVEILETILGYITDWNMLDADRRPVPFNREAGLELFDDLDDGEVISWLIGAWFEARAKRREVPKG